MGTKDEGEQGRGRGQEEQIPTLSRAAEKTSEAREGLQWSRSIFITFIFITRKKNMTNRLSQRLT